jgi:hypothetical protein
MKLLACSYFCRNKYGHITSLGFRYSKARFNFWLVLLASRFCCRLIDLGGAVFRNVTEMGAIAHRSVIGRDWPAGDCSFVFLLIWTGELNSARKV